MTNKIISELQERIKEITAVIAHILPVFILLLCICAPCGTHARSGNVSISIAYISFDFTPIPQSYDISQGDYLRIKMVYKNQGNISITPKTDIIIRKEKEIAYHAVFPYPGDQSAIKPYATREINALEIPTGNLETGRYTAVISVSHNDNFTVKKELSFSIGKVKVATAASTARPGNNLWPTVRTSVSLILLLMLFLVISSASSDRAKDKSKLPGNNDAVFSVAEKIPKKKAE